MTKIHTKCENPPVTKIHTKCERKYLAGNPAGKIKYIRTLGEASRNIRGTLSELRDLLRFSVEFFCVLIIHHNKKKTLGKTKTKTKTTMSQQKTTGKRKAAVLDVPAGKIPFLDGWTINFKKMPKYKEFEEGFTVKLDYHIFKLIVDERPRQVNDGTIKEIESKILKNMNKRTGELVIFHEGHGKDGIGRRYADGNVSLVPFSKYVKHTVLHYLGWRDIDMVKCHTSIVNEMLKKVEGPSEVLELFISDFSRIAEEVIEHHSADKTNPLLVDDVKWLFIMMTYGGGFNKWANEIETNTEMRDRFNKPIMNKDNLHPYITKFKAHAETVIKKIYEGNPVMIKKFKKSGQSEYELSMTMTSYWLQCIENHILWIQYKDFVRRGILIPKTCSLEFDGSNLPPSPIEYNVDEVLEELNALILRETGFAIKMKFKGYDYFVMHDIIEKRRAMVINDEDFEDKMPTRIKSDVNDKLIEKFFKLDLHGFRVIEEDCRYVSMEGTPYQNDIYSPEKVIILDAYMGVGKSTAMKRLANHYKRILILSPRVSFSAFMAKEFKTAIYLDVQWGSDKLQIFEKITCSMESLHKIPQDIDYDLVIMDESESNLAAFNSVTMRHKISTSKRLEEILMKAEKVVMASAFLTKLTIDFVRDLFPESVCFIRNTTKPPKRKAIYHKPENFTADLMKNLQAGKKTYLFSGRKRKLDDINEDMAELAKTDPIIQEILEKSKTYSSAVDSQIIQEDMANLEACWIVLMLVLTSPTTTIGASHNPTIADFHNVWMYFFPSCTVGDAFQSSMRVRKLIDDEVHFTLPDKKTLQNMKNSAGAVLKLFEDYTDGIAAKKKELYLANIRTIRLLVKAGYDKNVTDRLFNWLEALEDNATPVWLRRVYYNASFEENLCRASYKNMMFHYFEKCGYEVEGWDECVKVEGDTVSKMHYDINEIDDIKNDEELYKLQKNRENGKATVVEKNKLEKYYFKKSVDVSVLSPEAVDYWFNVWMDQYTKHVVNNIFDETYGKIEDMFSEKLLDVGIDHYQSQPARITNIKK